MRETNWTVRVFTSDRDRAIVYVRSHQFTAGAPVQFDEKYNGITALEYVLGAIGADIVNGMLSACHRRRIEVESIEALVSGELENPLVYLGVVGETGHPGIKKVSINVYVNSLEPEEGVRRVWDEALKRSPLVNTLRESLNLDMKVVM